MSGGLWRSWASRWERFQETYVPYREAQLTLMTGYIAQHWRENELRLVDLCSGPGSLTARLLETLPSAHVTAVDWDPWLLEMGRRTVEGGQRVSWVEADLRRPDWTEALPNTEFHAVLVVTAMHWFTPVEQQRIYRDVHGLLPERGMFLNADQIPTGSSEVQHLAKRYLGGWRARQQQRPDGEHWADFWRDARREPSFTDLIEERDRRLHPMRPFLPRPVSFHTAALSEAGFRQVGEVWRWHESAVLLAIR
jgi:ubiquinone/menaquinone biosynthesis C-methylase UbiE